MNDYENLIQKIDEAVNAVDTAYYTSGNDDEDICAELTSARDALEQAREYAKARS